MFRYAGQEGLGPLGLEAGAGTPDGRLIGRFPLAAVGGGCRPKNCKNWLFPKVNFFSIIQHYEYRTKRKGIVPLGGPAG